MDLKKIGEIISEAKKAGQEVLLETEGAALLEAAGISIPRSILVRNPIEAAELKVGALPGDKVVIKVISPDILHKTDVGGVAIIPNIPAQIVETVSKMEKKFSNSRLIGFTVNEFISYDRLIGRELIFGMRWTNDFGPIVNVGAGGIYTEFLASNFSAGRGSLILSPHLPDSNNRPNLLNDLSIIDIISGKVRNQSPLVSNDEIKKLIDIFLELSLRFIPAEISEFEINPIAITNGRLVALDVLVKLSSKKLEDQERRPIEKIKSLLEPKSAAIVGVSEKINPGHIILNNLIRDGFDKNKIFVIKPNSSSIEGCKCIPDIASLPEKVDLLILAVGAIQVPAIISEVVRHEKAESVIVIPGGLEEKSGTEKIVSEMKERLEHSRQSKWRGPVINGGNCLGIRSVPGKYNTLFIPEEKLPMPGGEVAPLVLLSQSGAFAISRTSKLRTVNPKYIITVGNQMDLTIGDYLGYLAEDSELQVFAVYVEGFKELDGLKFIRAAEALRKQGKIVVLYRAGRTSAGAKASASHTASIAGDYSVTRELCKRAGVVLAESYEDFEDLIKLFTFLRDKEVKGLKLGAVSNAGCECVALADNLGMMKLATFQSHTDDKLKDVFKKSGISEIVDVHNPIDLTPMANDTAYDDTFRTILDDSGVDIGVMGCVPLSVALKTLGNIEESTSIVQKLIRFRNESPKAWIVVVDSGSIYDPMVERLEQREVPVFRTADRALRLFNVFCSARVSQK